MSGFANLFPWLLLLVALLVLGILIYLVILVLRARREASAAVEDAHAPPEPEEPPAEADAGRSSGYLLRDSFRQGLNRLKGLVAARDYRYEIPWFMLLGQSGSRRTDLLADAGLTLPIGREQGSELGCTWWFFDRGVVLDLAGEYVLRADGRSADDRGWSTFLRLLERARPQRPIDGVVLTISCRDVYGVNRESPQEVAELEQKATALYGRIWQAQKTLGIRFPVYVVVTGCERLPGFASFAEEVPRKLQQGMLGWSSPHAIDTAFRPSWTDEAFDCVKYRLELAQLEIFAQGTVRRPDDVFVLPGEFDSMREPLKVFLNRLFQPSAYHESILCRGLYFTGDNLQPEPAPAEAEVALPPMEMVELDGEIAASRRALFLRDVFERKVFPEARLAAPTASVFATRNLRTRLAQAVAVTTALVLGVGSWIGYGRLQAREAGLTLFLKETAADLQDVRALQKGPGASPIASVRLEEWAYGLVEDLIDIDASPYGSLFIPSSWLSGFNDDLREAFVSAYSGVIFHALGLELERRASELTSSGLAYRAVRPAADGSAGDSGESVPIRSQPAFLDLEEFAVALAELESVVETFNGLSQSSDLNDLSEVFGFLFDRQLPEQFFQNSKLYEQALGKVQYEKLKLERYREEAELRTRELVQKLYRDLFREGVLIRTLDGLDGELEKLGQRSISDEAVVFGEIVELTRRSELMLSQPGLRWAFGERFSLGREYDEVLGLLSASRFLRAGSGEQADDAVRLVSELQGEAAWIIHQREIADLGSRVTGPLLERRDGRPLMQLSADVLLVKTALRDFLRQDFMLFDASARLRTDIPSGERLHWETNLLNQAAGLYEPYQRFRDQGLAQFPTRFRGVLDSVARQRVAAGVVDLVTRAQRTAPVSRDVGAVVLENQLATEVERFRTAVEPLTRVLEIFQRLELWDLHADLSGIVVDQGMDLLGAVDELLRAGELYLPRDDNFDWWDGASSVALGAFAVQDASALGEYLEVQGGRMSRLARNYAQELVQTLEGLGGLRRLGSRPLISRWQTIIKELQNYDEKKPGNALVALETLISEEMVAISLDNCFEREVPSRAAVTGNFFLDRQNRLRLGIFNRCRTLAGERAAVSYAQLEGFFNQRLAGRYPFAERVDDNFPVEAEPGTLREFFRLYDELASDIRGVPADSAAFRGRGARIQDFVKQMAAVRKFLAGFLDAEQPLAVPAYNFEVQFRVNRSNELGGDQIIRWELDVGDQRIVHPPSEPQAIWTLGMPIALTFRWAEGSNWRPAPDLQRPTIDVGDLSTEFGYANRWSLISLIRGHLASPEDFRRYDDPRPHTLKFQMPTRSVSAEQVEEPKRKKKKKSGQQASSSEPGELGEARLFIRLSLIAPETETPILLPSFPYEAPTLADRTASSAGP